MGDVRDWGKIVETQNPNHIAKMTGEWRRGKGFETGWPNFAEKLMLIITEGDEAMEALDGMRAAHQVISQPQFHRLGDACQKLMHYLENYVEEWVDVMVRIFDLVDACELELDSLDTYGDGPTAQPIPQAELVSSRGMVRFTLLCRALSNAMEVFRDVTFEANGFVPQDSDENNKRVEDIGRWLSNAALVAAHAIEDVGVYWEKPYAAKMEVNEGRPKRHGRQR
jgi:hypothetical protein